MNVSLILASPADAGTLARLRLRLEQAAEAEGLLDVAYTTVDSPVGPLLLAATPKGLVRVAYDIEDHDRVLDALSQRLSPRVLRAPQRLDAAARELDEYFGGRRQAFDLPLDLSLSTGFRQLVQRHLPEIGYGQTRTYGQVAAARRKPEGGQGGRHRLRHQPAARRRALPPGAAGQRGTRPLRRGTRGEGNAPQSGGGMSDSTQVTNVAPGTDPWQRRVDSGDWDAVRAELDSCGGALLPQLLTPEEAQQIRGLYGQAGRFRSTVNMAAHRFGEGEYRYFAAPYPEPVERLKQALYPRLLPIARDWWARLGRPAPWPDTLDEWLRMCHEAGQVKPTAILLRYRAGDWNALHRDLYGDLVFPLQVVINLQRPGVDHSGGEFLLMEQRPRAQSRGTATLLPHCHGYLFTTRDRPVRSARGWSAAPVRHGVSVIRSGERHALGLVFHDAP